MNWRGKRKRKESSDDSTYNSDNQLQSNTTSAQE